MWIPDDKLREANDRAKALQNPYAIRRTMSEYDRTLINNTKGGYFIAEKKIAQREQRKLSKFFGKSRQYRIHRFPVIK